jgi:dTDP-4-amino-4,6-dideoxygalactose transaminase
MLELAILGGTPIRTDPYPAWPEYDERDLEAVARVIRSRNWGGFPYPGPNSAAFAQKFAELQGGGYAVLMANGTITMEVALRASAIGWGDEVIVPACTFQATAAAPMAAGAIPVIVDIDPDTFCIDPKKVEAAITHRTRAIIPVHLASQAADMDAILEIAERHDLVVIEDCAHAHGGRWNGKGLGTIGHFGSFSLQSSKTLTTGEGGVLLCRTAETAARAASLIDCGRPHSLEFPFREVESLKDGEQIFTMGANYRMSEIQAALGLVALERFPQQMAQRIELRSYLEESLSEIPGIRLLRRDPRHTSPAFYRYSFAIDPQVFGANNQVVCGLLWTEGIPCELGYPPMHRYELFNPTISKLPVPSAFPEYFQFEKMHFPEAERICGQEAVWLEEQVFRAGTEGIDDVARALRKILANRDYFEQAAAKLKEMYLS